MPADPQTDRPRHSVSAEGEQERRFVTTPPMHPKPTPRPPQRRQAPPPKQQKPAQPVPFTLDPEALFAKAATISKPGRALAALASAEHPDRLYAAALVLRRELSAERLAHTRMTVDIIRNRLWRREHRLPDELRAVSLWAAVDDRRVAPETLDAMARPSDLDALFERTLDAVVGAILGEVTR